MCRALLRFPHLSFIPPVPYPPPSGHLPLEGKALSVVILFFTYACIRSDNARKAAFSYRRSLPPWGRGTAQRRSGALVNDALETISPDLFHPASPIQPPPLRGTSFHRKEGVSTRAPSKGRGCRAQRGGVGFLFGRRSRLLFAFPFEEGRLRNGARVLVYRLLETISYSLSYR